MANGLQFLPVWGGEDLLLDVSDAATKVVLGGVAITQLVLGMPGFLALTGISTSESPLRPFGKQAMRPYL
jgi:hypothetical protein